MSSTKTSAPRTLLTLPSAWIIAIADSHLLPPCHADGSTARLSRLDDRACVGACAPRLRTSECARSGARLRLRPAARPRQKASELAAGDRKPFILDGDPEPGAQPELGRGRARRIRPGVPLGVRLNGREPTPL